MRQYIPIGSCAAAVHTNPDGAAKNAAAEVCQPADHELPLQQANELAGFGGKLGSKSKRLAWIATPFILERANPPKVGDAKPWTFGFTPVVARLPKGWAGEEPVRPRAFCI